MATAAEIARENGKKGGRPPGKKNAATLEKERVLEQFRQRTMRMAESLYNAQAGLAVGSQYLYKIEKEKIVGPKGGVSYKKLPPKLVTEQWEIEDYLNRNVTEGDTDDDKDPGATYYFLTAKDPENQALEALLNRTFGKPKEIVEVQGDIVLRIDI